MNFVGQIIELVLGTFIVLLFVRLIVDWIQMFARSWVPRGPVLVVLEGVYTITDPPVKALRKVIPPLRLGGVAIDLSFIAVLLICYILLSLNRAILLTDAGSRGPRLACPPTRERRHALWFQAQRTHAFRPKRIWVRSCR